MNSFISIVAKRKPTSKDKCYNLNSVWYDSVSCDIYILLKFKGGIPIWSRFVLSSDDKSVRNDVFITVNGKKHVVNANQCLDFSSLSPINISFNPSTNRVSFIFDSKRFLKQILSCDEMRKDTTTIIQQAPYTPPTIQEALPAFEPDHDYKEGDFILHQDRSWGAKSGFRSTSAIDLDNWEALDNSSKSIVVDGGGSIVPNADGAVRYVSSQHVSVVKVGENSVTFVAGSGIIETYLLIDQRGNFAVPSSVTSPKSVLVRGVRNIVVNMVNNEVVIGDIDGYMLSLIKDSDGIETITDVDNNYLFNTNSTGDILPKNNAIGISMEIASNKAFFNRFESNHSYLENETILEENFVYTAKVDFTSLSTFNEADWSLGREIIDLEDDAGNVVDNSSGTISVIGTFGIETRVVPSQPSKLVIIPNSEDLFDVRKRTYKIMAYGSYASNGDLISSVNLEDGVRVGEGIYEIFTENISTIDSVDGAFIIGSCVGIVAEQILCTVQRVGELGFKITVNIRVGNSLVDSAFDLLLVCTCNENQPNYSTSLINVNPIVASYGRFDGAIGGGLETVHYNKLVLNVDGSLTIGGMAGLDAFVLGSVTDFTGGGANSGGFFYNWKDPRGTYSHIVSEQWGSKNGDVSFILFGLPDQESRKGLLVSDFSFPINIEYVAMVDNNGDIIRELSNTKNTADISVSVLLDEYTIDLGSDIVGTNMLVLRSGVDIDTQSTKVFDKTSRKVVISVTPNDGITFAILSF